MNKLKIMNSRIGCLDANGALTFPTAEKLLKLLRGKNYTAEENISNLNIHRSAKEVFYKAIFDENALEITAKVSDVLLTKTELEQIFTLGYLLQDSELYFFSAVTRNETRELFEASELNKKIRFLATLKPNSMIDGGVGGLAEKISDNIIDVKNNFQNTLKVPLYSYQEKGLRWLMHCYANGIGAILGDDMGLGKSAQIIATISNLKAAGTLKHSLIVVPNSLIDNWVREFDFFTKDLSPYVHSGSTRGGLAERLQNEAVVITPYSILVNDISMLEELDIDLLVFDEASLLKNPDSQRYIAALRLNAFMAISVTGTPLENSLRDVWAISNIVSRDYLGDRDSFEAKFCKLPLNELLNEDLEEVENKTSNILLRRMKKDVLGDLPAKIDIHKAITMTASERNIYNNLCDEITKHHDGGASSLALIGNLRKLTTHPVLLDESIDPSFKYLCSTSSKFSVMTDLIREAIRKSEKVLIFANHIRMLDIFVKVLEVEFNCPVFKLDGTVEVEKRQNTIDVFSKIHGSSILCLNPIVAAMGLNITAANHVFHYSRQWNPALEIQATARAFRNGQTKEVNSYYLYYADSIEEIIDERLRQKTDLSEKIIHAVEHQSSEDEFYFNVLKNQRKITWPSQT